MQIPDTVTHKEQEENRRLRVLTIVTVGLVAMAPFFIYQYLSLGIPLISSALVVTVTLGLLSLRRARLDRNSRRGGWNLTGLLLSLLVLSNLQSGGFYDPNFAWLYVFPMLAALLVDARAGWIVTGIVFALTLAFWLAPDFGISIPDRIPPEQHAQQSLANRLSAIFAIGVILAAIASQQRFSRGLLEKSNEELHSEIERRAQMQQRLVRAERAASMGNLAAGLAHEINNPLTYVIGNLELLARDVDRAAETADARGKPKSQRLVSEALDGATRVADLVRDLKNFSRVDETQFEAVHLASALEQTARLVANEVRHRAQLEIDCDRGLYVFGNAGRVQQILLNLTVNAAQSIEVGSVDHNFVRVRCRASSGEIAIDVTDSGSGMPPEVVEHVFEPLFTTKDQGAGLGMGLFITSNVVKSLNGRIHVESAVGVGTTFSVFLPAAPRPTESIPSVAPAKRADTETRGVRILVIDDEESVLEYFKLALAHHHVTTEVDPHRALERICDGEDDVVLCDLMMPQKSGMTLYREVQQRAPDRAQRMIFMTAGSFDPHGSTFLQKLPGRWLEKPIDFEKLESLIEKRVRMSRKTEAV